MCSIIHLITFTFCWDISIKKCREDIYKLTIGNVSLHEISNGNGDRVVNFATYKNLTVKKTKSPHRNIHNDTSMSPDGESRSQIDHILIDRLRGLLLYQFTKKGNKTDYNNYRRI
jgi:hypothetical protein